MNRATMYRPPTSRCTTLFIFCVSLIYSSSFLSCATESISKSAVRDSALSSSTADFASSNTPLTADILSSTGPNADSNDTLSSSGIGTGSNSTLNGNFTRCIINGTEVIVNGTSCNATAAVVSSSSSSTGPQFIWPTLSSTGDQGPGIVIGKGGSSFGSIDAVFLTTVVDIWIDIILWTMVFTSFAFVGASFHGLRVKKGNRGWMWIWLPFLMMVVGAAVGFMHGAISAALIGAISVAIPYPVGIDIAAGLGIGQAICIIYFHLGRADFIHR